MTDLKKRLQQSHPGHFFLASEDIAGLEAHLMAIGVLRSDEQVTQSDSAGEGNMNCTLRVTTSQRTLIVKQARPWVEKYPQFDAPWDRIIREAEFYERLAEASPAASAIMPGRIAHDDATHLLILEDLGPHGDYRSVYHGEEWREADLLVLGSFLGDLHRIPKRGAFTNRAMRELNHAHIFVIPLQADNGLDLDAIHPGLAESARPYLNDTAYRKRVAELGDRAYLADGPCLLHGDFFPGSLVKTPNGPRVIDPEFAFFGAPEFDLGVFIAHLFLAQQATFTDAFLEGHGKSVPIDSTLVLQLAGVEIMRRLLGYAQLDLPLDLEARRDLLDTAHGLVMK